MSFRQSKATNIQYGALEEKMDFIYIISTICLIVISLALLIFFLLRMKKAASKRQERDRTLSDKPDPAFKILVEIIKTDSENIIA